MASGRSSARPAKDRASASRKIVRSRPVVGGGDRGRYENDVLVETPRPLDQEGIDAEHLVAAASDPGDLGPPSKPRRQAILRLGARDEDRIVDVVDDLPTKREERRLEYGGADGGCFEMDEDVVVAPRIEQDPQSAHEALENAPHLGGRVSGKTHELGGRRVEERFLPYLEAMLLEHREVLRESESLTGRSAVGVGR